MSIFKQINTINDVLPAVAGKKEIRFSKQPNGITVGCYMFMDSSTFDSAEALECRGVAFDESGAIVSRPLHKFFNLGEKSWLTAEALGKQEIHAIYEKLDGSMIATAWIEGRLHWRSKKSFGSDVVALTKKLLELEGFQGLVGFSERVASRGMTAIFELTHPDARIVVDAQAPKLTLLHVRDNVTGEYLLLDGKHEVHAWIDEFGVPVAPVYTQMDLPQALESLQSMRDMEGYVIQLKSGEMVKLKCPWYLRLHRSITFLRERDIAELALSEGLDDVKAALTEAGIDLSAVDGVESRLKSILEGLMDQVEGGYEAHKLLDRKAFAIALKDHELFGLMMQMYLGREVDIKDWYRKARLRNDFSLRVLADGALAEAMEG